MDRKSALEKLRRIVAAVKDGKAPYRVLEIAVYGSVAQGEEKVRDLDLYFQLDRDSVPGPDLYDELVGLGTGVESRLRRALKKYPQERVDITWGWPPWEKRREDFAGPEDIDRLTDELLVRSTQPKARARLERQREKVKAKGYERPVPGIVVYRSEGAPDPSAKGLL